MSGVGPFAKRIIQRTLYIQPKEFKKRRTRYEWVKRTLDAFTCRNH